VLVLFPVLTAPRKGRKGRRGPEREREKRREKRGHPLIEIVAEDGRQGVGLLKVAGFPG
jgi:hypothetical protein